MSSCVISLTLHFLSIFLLSSSLTNILVCKQDKQTQLQQCHFEGQWILLDLLPRVAFHIYHNSFVVSSLESERKDKEKEKLERRKEGLRVE
jgi:hypothetical protein